MRICHNEQRCFGSVCGGPGNCRNLILAFVAPGQDESVGVVRLEETERDREQRCWRRSSLIYLLAPAAFLFLPGSVHVRVCVLILVLVIEILALEVLVKCAFGVCCFTTLQSGLMESCAKFVCVCVCV